MEDEEGKCFNCKQSLKNEICLFDNNTYHKYCCGYCKHSWTKPAKPVRRNTLITKEKTPPPQLVVAPERSPSPTLPTPRLEKAKSNPRKLSFTQLDSFICTDSLFVKCFTCKQPFVGQKFLSSKVGSFNCFNCHAINGPKCYMCARLFEETDIVYKDDEKHSCCESCINIYHETKNKVKSKVGALFGLKKRKDSVFGESGGRRKDSIFGIVEESESFEESSERGRSDEGSGQTSPSATATAAAANFNKITNGIIQKIEKRCYACAQNIDVLRYITYKAKEYHDRCFQCYKCRKSLANQLFYEEASGLACDECKNVQKCAMCQEKFESGAAIYLDDTDDGSSKYCEKCFSKKMVKTCGRCLNAIELNQDCLTYGGKTFHQDCFRCEKCAHKIMPGEQIFKGSNNDDVFCNICAVLG